LIFTDIRKTVVGFNITGKYINEIDYVDLNKSLNLNIDKNPGYDVTITVNKINTVGTGVDSADLTIELYKGNQQEEAPIVVAIKQATQQAADAVVSVKENIVESIKARPTVAVGAGITVAIALLGSFGYLIFFRPK
jgi:hypothetical protein